MAKWAALLAAPGLFLGLLFGVLGALLDLFPSLASLFLQLLLTLLQLFVDAFLAFLNLLVYLLIDPVLDRLPASSRAEHGNECNHQQHNQFSSHDIPL